MVFIESILFAKFLTDYLHDEEFRKLQNFLIEQPDAGDLIKGTGGLRKLRWGLENQGKRSGMRIIYYWEIEEDQIYFLSLYTKNEMKDLTEKEKKMLKQLLENW